MPQDDTITAVSTPHGNGAIGIIRVSGPEAVPIVERIWRGKICVKDCEPKVVYLGHINDLEGGVVDQVIIFRMKSPSSYTGEDMVEIQGHGGQAVLENILKTLLRAGARLAEPGEFTKRAFLNGRMDLAQAEAVGDLIQAVSQKAARLAGRQLEGRLSRFVGRLRNNLKVMRAQMEAQIDFPEDEDIQGLGIHHEEAVERIDAIISEIDSLVATYREGRSFRDGVRVAIVGKPNAGKSSLFNALLEEDRSIVHSAPGTTRDLVEESLDLNGLVVRFIDTAGIRKGEGTIESEGIRRAHERLKQADIVLVVIDSSRPLDPEDEMVFESVQGMPVFYLYNKADLIPAFSSNILRGRLGDVAILTLSAKDGTGIDLLKDALYSHFVRKDSKTAGSDLILTNLRHRTALEKGLESLKRVREGCFEKRSLEFLVADLSYAMDFLGEVTGQVTNDEILGEIFSKFCIGK